jgi:hypothetical protein
MVSIALFPQRMNLRASQVIAAATRAVQAAAKVAVKTVTETTPADTGQARSNWITTRDIKFTGTIPAYSPGSHLGIGESANAGAAQAQGNIAIDSFNAKSNKSVIIQNNLPYIEGLNDGSVSRQSSQMVPRALQAAVVAVKAIKIFGD